MTEQVSCWELPRSSRGFSASLKGAYPLAVGGVEGIAWSHSTFLYRLLGFKYA